MFKRLVLMAATVLGFGVGMPATLQARDGHHHRHHHHYRGYRHGYVAPYAYRYPRYRAYSYRPYYYRPYARRSYYRPYYYRPYYRPYYGGYYGSSYRPYYYRRPAVSVSLGFGSGFYGGYPYGFGGYPYGGSYAYGW